ncbi:MULTISPECIES: dicarboxylate/amino acid:cation symporter [Variovorax]|jgi:Na+/H+-dicarboxylate symporter|uniref:dicarboxylate/amino acid:cation symporter n=1 Tax=Variovorax TaxID=34072 RepID=UPI00086EEA5B|nr:MULTISPECIES: cation:dicarboxylase symporter family transporter [Variovorax]MBN8758444.1 cation:dicarboxylase symporter family transporter [Variovorax sp.]ODU18913.1 MAG: sodium:dicarboxylate symporter [Variovorax sp. SCN 67-85]ODV18610.1 MAG: sodium:dicarboxylate symporter [Variovorax sp. SCN 67-20]OJZ05905.1 MAG: sodium:dicarboxylate symporter [Variovorax sp. 67-131]UKI06073.1 dicarboxylate/amino acid:cation symporter [Variovorax paradoxus]
MNSSKFYAFVLNPWVVIISLGAGVAFGMLAPALATTLGFVGDIYVDLLKMITLPFMVSAVIFSLQRLFRDGGTASLLGRVALVFLAFSAFVAIAGAATLLILRPGENLPSTTMQTFGQIVGGDLSASDTAMNLRGVDEVKKTASFADMLVSLVPANIFSALANGDTLKTLVFALLFGLAVGHVPTRISDGLTQALETVYHACQTLMRWLSFPLPVVLFCMSAAQLGKTGIEPLRAMGAFVVAFLVVSVLLLAVAAVIIWKRSNGTLGQTLNALRGPFALALATRSSATCMPIMIESLVTRLGFARSRVELLVPLTVSLLRIGPVVYYVCATLFIAQIYGRSLSPVEIGIVLTSSVLAGFASAGMTGLVTVSLIGMTCTYLGLPFEAAFILFLAVDPVCDMLRTLVLVIGNTAAVAVVCPRPLKI